MDTSQEVLSRAKRRIGVLARRAGDEVLTPKAGDDPLLEGYLGDALGEIARRTGRLRTSIEVTTSAGTAQHERPPHLDTILDARVHDKGLHEIDVDTGYKVRQAARSPTAEEGRPDSIGEHAGSLWLYPVPDAAYTIEIEAEVNGEVGDSAPADSTEPPTLDGLVALTPPDFDRALVAYLAAEWFTDNGEHELAQQSATRFETDVTRYESAPNQKTTTTRPHNPLNL